MAKLRKRQTAALRVLRRSGALLFLNVAAVLAQAVCLDVAVDEIPAGEGNTVYDYELLKKFSYAEMGVTVLSYLLLISYYRESWHSYLKLELLPRAVGSKLYSTPFFYRGELLGSLLAEALVLTIQPVPWATSNVWAYEALGLFTFFRIYLVGRFVRDLAQVQAQREVLHSMQEGRSAVPLSFRLAFKILYAARPAETLSTVFAISYAALAFAIHVSERDVDATFDDYNNCFWFIIVTMTTVGYGDIYLSTALTSARRAPSAGASRRSRACGGSCCSRSSSPSSPTTSRSTAARRASFSSCATTCSAATRCAPPPRSCRTRGSTGADADATPSTVAAAAGWPAAGWPAVAAGARPGWRTGRSSWRCCTRCSSTGGSGRSSRWRSRRTRTCSSASAASSTS